VSCRRMRAMPLRTITATRYITPLREGGFAAGHRRGRRRRPVRAQVRRCRSGAASLDRRARGRRDRAGARSGRAEIVFGASRCRTRPHRARPEDPGPESAPAPNLLRGSAGLNLALDYLPGSVTFDPLMARGRARTRLPQSSGSTPFVTNLDRTPRNTNMLVWHGKLWLIDHGAALYFQHDWRDYLARAASPFTLIKDHVPAAVREQAWPQVDAQMAATLTPERLAGIVQLIPDAWLHDEPTFRQQGRASQRLSELPDAAPRRAARIRHGGHRCPRSARMTTP